MHCVIMFHAALQVLDVQLHIVSVVTNCAPDHGTLT